MTNLRGTISVSGLLNRHSNHLLLVAGSVWILPGVTLLAQSAWRTEAGSIGPLTLVFGALLLHSDLRNMMPRASRPTSYLTLVCLAVGLLGYTYAVTTAFVALAALSAWLVLVCMIEIGYGWSALQKAWFPLAYLLLVTPLPYSLTFSGSLRLGRVLAASSAYLLNLWGIAAAYSGTSLYIDQYELAVEIACAGVSSTISLIAVSVAYARWAYRSSWEIIAVLLLAALPIAFVSNLLRVLLLAVAVAVWGSRALSSALHPLSGAVSFTIALMLSLIVGQLATKLKLGRGK